MEVPISELQANSSTPNKGSGQLEVDPSQLSSANSGDLSSIPDITDGPAPKNTEQSPLKFKDMISLNALSTPEEKKSFLETKWKFAVPTPDGKSFLVGDSADSMEPIDTENVGSASLMALSRVANMIVPIGGQIAGTIAGTPGGPAGMIAGSMAGSAIGQYAQNEMAKNIPGSQMTEEKAKSDAAISGLFGAAGEGLGQAIGYGAKTIIKPAVAKALDGMTQTAIDNGKLPGYASLLSKVFKFTSGADEKQINTGVKKGFYNIFSNPKNMEAGEIDNIAQQGAIAYQQKKDILGKAIDAADTSLISGASKNGQIVGTTPVINDTVDALERMGIVTKYEATSADASNGITGKFKFNDVPSGIPTKDLKLFLQKIGVENHGDPNMFHIPETSNVSVEDAIKAKRLFQRAFNNPTVDSRVGSIMKGALYGEGATAEYPKGAYGLASSLNSTAESLGNDTYQAAYKDYANLMKSNEVLKPYGFDINNPVSGARFLEKINNLHDTGKDLIANLDKQIGNSAILDRSENWAVAQHINHLNPNILRLSLVSSMLGFSGALGDNKLEKVGLAFGLASGAGVKRILSTSGATKVVGKKILSTLADTASKKQIGGRAILSQLVASKAKR